MTTRRRGSAAVEAEPRPLIETNPEGAFKILEMRYSDVEKLDPSNRALIEDVQKYLLDDVGKIFGVGSAEHTLIWQNPIYEEGPYLLGDEYDDDDLDEGSWRNQDRAKKVTAGIEQMLPRIRRLIERACERAVLHAPQGEDPMNPFKDFEEHFQLIKRTGERVPARGVWGDDVVTVYNGTRGSSARGA